MRNSDDESLFAWEDDTLIRSGLLAPRPSSFRYSGDIKALNPPHWDRPPYSMTNKGLQIELYLTKAGVPDNSQTILNCTREGWDSKRLITLSLRNAEDETEYFQRVSCHSLGSCDKPSELNRRPTTLQIPTKVGYFKQEQTSAALAKYHCRCSFTINIRQLFAHGFQVTEQYVANAELGRWMKETDSESRIMLQNSSALLEFAEVGAGDSEGFVLKISATARIATVRILLGNRHNLSPTTIPTLLRETPGPIFGVHWDFSRKISMQLSGTRMKLYSGKTLQVTFHQKDEPHRLLFFIELSIAS